MISMLSRFQLSEVDLLCATCTLIFFLKQGCISHHCGQLNNIEINFKRLHLVTFMSYIQPIAWSAELAPLGFRLLRRAAFPFIRANDNLNTIDSAVCYQSMYHHILPLFQFNYSVFLRWFVALSCDCLMCAACLLLWLSYICCTS